MENRITRSLKSFLNKPGIHDLEPSLHRTAEAIISGHVSSEQISRQIGRSARTVSTYLHRLMTLTESPDMPSLVHFCLTNYRHAQPARRRVTYPPASQVNDNCPDSISTWTTILCAAPTFCSDMSRGFPEMDSSRASLESFIESSCTISSESRDEIIDAYRCSLKDPYPNRHYSVFERFEMGFLVSSLVMPRIRGGEVDMEDFIISAERVFLYLSRNRGALPPERTRAIAFTSIRAISRFIKDRFASGIGGGDLRIILQGLAGIYSVSLRNSIQERTQNIP